MKTSIKILLLSATILLAAGCGESGPTMIPVYGEITFDGEACPAAGVVIFSPIETPEGVPKRPAIGKFGKDGKFETRSYKPGDGLLPGRYRVRIECLSGSPPARLGGIEEVSYIAAGYQSEDLTVSADSGAVEVNYDLPLKKGPMKSVPLTN